MVRNGLWLTFLGLTIACVESSAPEPHLDGTLVRGPPAAHWELGGPSFPAIGVTDEPATHALDRPRFVRLMPDSIISVVHGLNQIRLFRTDGTFVGEIGRAGDGPGEFRRIYQYRRLASGEWLVLGADPLSLRRLAADGDESERRTISVPIEAVNIRAAMSGAGRVVAFESWFPPTKPVEGSRARVVRDTVRLVALDLEGGSERIGEPLGGYPWLVLRDTWNGAPLAAVPSISAAGRTVAATDGESYVVQVVDLNSGSHMVVRLDEEPRGATESDLERWYADRRAYNDRMGRRVAPPSREWRPGPPESLPAYAQVLVDEVGCVWARRYRVPPADEFTWDVLDPRGLFLGRISMPGNLAVYEIHAGLVVGVTEDELGVGRIAAFDLPAESRSRSCDVPG